MGRKPKNRIFRPVGRAPRFIGYLTHHAVVATYEVICEFTAERGELRPRVSEPFGQRACATIGSASLRRRVTVDGDQRSAERSLQRELLPVALRTFRSRLESLQSFRKMADCLQIGGSLDSVSPGPHPISHGPVSQARFGEMLGQRLGLCLRNRRKPLL